jgi:hypothetical protein
MALPPKFRQIPIGGRFAHAIENGDTFSPEYIDEQ